MSSYVSTWSFITLSAVKLSRFVITDTQTLPTLISRVLVTIVMWVWKRILVTFLPLDEKVYSNWSVQVSFQWLIQTGGVSLENTASARNLFSSAEWFLKLRGDYKNAFDINMDLKFKWSLYRQYLAAEKSKCDLCESGTSVFIFLLTVIFFWVLHW